MYYSNSIESIPQPVRHRKKTKHYIPANTSHAGSSAEGTKQKKHPNQHEDDEDTDQGNENEGEDDDRLCDQIHTKLERDRERNRKNTRETIPSVPYFLFSFYNFRSFYNVYRHPDATNASNCVFTIVTIRRRFTVSISYVVQCKFVLLSCEIRCMIYPWSYL